MIITEPILLLRKSTEVNGLEEAEQITRRLREVMRDTGEDSLAAPCTGILKRLFIYIHGGTEYVVINPTYKAEECDVQIVSEGCPSWPKKYFMSRLSRIAVSYQTLLSGSLHGIERVIEGVEAIVFQHECDHLHGIHPLRDGYVEGPNGEKRKSVISLSHPRNSPCPCGGGKKFKKCCERLI